jgi:hypothetical protein
MTSARLEGAATATLMSILSGMVVVCNAAAGDVTLPFYDGFESCDAGQHPGMPWRTLFGGADAYVSDQRAHTGDRSFLLESQTNWSRVECVDLAEVQDQFSYEVAVFPDPQHPEPAWVGFPQPFGNSCAMYNRFNVYGGSGALADVLFVQGTSGGITVPVGQIPTGAWATVRADLDFTTLTADLWLNGELKIMGAPILPREFDDPDYGHAILNKWGAMQYNWPPDGRTGTIHIDDVALLPEPAAFLLLAVTAAGVHPRRTARAA